MISRGPASILALVFCSSFLADAPAFAIPAFARKYGTSCVTCHVAFPKRNAFGEAFRRNGYVMPKGDALHVKEEPVSLGDPPWKELFPDSIWPGVLPRNFPLSLLVHSRFVYSGTEPAGERAGFDMPHELEFIVGTAFGEYLGVFGDWKIYDSGGTAAGIERLFFQFNDLAGPKDAVNVKVGRFEPGITSGYTSSNRLTLDRPLTLDYAAAGDWSAGQRQSGVEASGVLGHRFEYAAGVVNGEGKTVLLKNRKDVYARIGYKWGGIGLDGSGGEASTGRFNGWVDDSFTLGGFTYVGNTRHTFAGRPGQIPNDFVRFGLDARACYRDAEIAAAWITGKDEDAFGDAKRLDHTALFVEGDYAFYPWLLGVVRVSRARSELGEDERDKYWEILPHVSMLYRANVRISVEGSFRVDQARSIGGISVEPSNRRAFRIARVNLAVAF